MYHDEYGGAAPTYVLTLSHKGTEFEFGVRSTQTIGFVAKLAWQHKIGSVSRLMEYTLVGPKGVLLNPDTKLCNAHISRNTVYRLSSRWRRPSRRG